MPPILLPAVSLMLLTMAVWLFMTFRRVSVSRAKNIDPQSLVTPQQSDAIYDDLTVAASNCFKNLFETPVIFYAICGFIALAGVIDELYMNLAWAYLGLRVLQAAVHCTYNKVMHRFLVYLASCLVLWVMVIRFFIGMA